MKASDFYIRTRDARKVIVVDLGFLGDSVHLIPALWEIKRQYPAAELHTVSAPVGRDVLSLVPCVDHAWAMELDPGKRTLAGHLRLIRALRRERFDVALNFSGADRTVIVTALTGARWRVGHEGGRRHFWNRWLIPHWVPRQSTAQPVYEQRRQVLAALGFPLHETRFDLKPPAAEAAWAAGRVPGGSIHFSIGASDPLREWPVASWAALAGEILRQHPRISLVVTAGASDREQSSLRQMQAAVTDSRLMVITEKLTIARLSAVMSRCRLHVGCDTGSLHLAVALGLQTVSLFRESGNYREWAPSGVGHRQIVVPCACAHQKIQPCRTGARQPCLHAVPVSGVAERIGECLAGEWEP